ncbi:MAG: hypothetical protein B6I29_02460 [Marinitoga sp. 4572_148]|nr:MAG: hypothetical protein B6I29_02460 [Marinitoga sp. 4572_148]
MKKLIIIFLLITSIVFSQNLTEGEKKARRLFSESLKAFYSGKKYDARLKLEEAMTNQIYLKDVSYFWYFAAKLDLLLGNVEKAKEDLNNILFFSPSNNEAISLLNFINSLNNIGKKIQPQIKLKEIGRIQNIINGNEKFYVVNDFVIINSIAYMLDIENDLIYYTNLDNTLEGWIKLKNIIDEKFIPFNIYYDQRTDYFYISGNTGLYVAKNFSQQKVYKFDKINKSSNLLLMALDKIGRFWTYNAKNNSIYLLDFTGKLVKEIALDDRCIITSGSLSENNLYLLDIKNKQILIFSLETENITKIIPLKNKHMPLQIIALPYDVFLVTYIEDGVYAYLNNEVIKLFEFPYLLKYNNGVLMKFDYSKYEMILDQIEFVSDIIPYYVFIYSIDFDVSNMKITLKVNTISPGDNYIDFIDKKIYVTDSEGRYAFNYKKDLKKTQIYRFDNMEYLFLEMLPLLNNDSVIILNDKENYNFEKYISVKNIVPLMFSNISLFVVSDKTIDESIKSLIHLTRGEIIPEKYYEIFENYIKRNYKVIQSMNYRIFPPIAPGIRPVKIYLQTDNKLINDTLYYYSEGVGIAE